MITLTVIALLSDSIRERSLPAATNGNIDLSAYNLQSVNYVPLNGYWRFDWGEFASQSTLSDQNQFNTILVPSNWQASSITGGQVNNKGYATVSLMVTLDKHYEQLAISIPKIGSAFSLFVNDTEIASAGVLGKTKATETPHYKPQMVLFTPPDKQFILVLQISNHNFYYAGLWQSIKIGLPENLAKHQFRAVLQTSFIVAVFLTICAFNFIQFSLYTEDKTPLLIALTCILLALREMEQSNILQIIGLHEFSFATNIRISYLTFYGGLPLFVCYFYNILKSDYHRPIVLFIIAICAVFIALTLFTPVSVFSPSMPVFQILSLMFICYILLGMGKAVYHKRPNVNILIFGGLFIAGLAVNDILHSLRIIDSVTLISFGLVAFVMCQNYLIYSAFTQASKDNVYLNTALKQRNNDLEKFSAQLEDKITQRTFELEKANHKLANLANEDPLTKLLNRRGLIAEINQSKQMWDTQDIPFCLIIIDFDRFKLLNDTLGHNAGDKVLTASSEILSSISRKNDKVGRWGGEEFLFLAADTELDTASAIANRLRQEIEKTLSPLMDYAVTITVGVAQCAKSESIDDCIKRADDALYAGKNNGRNQIKVSTI